MSPLNAKSSWGFSPIENWCYLRKLKPKKQLNFFLKLKNIYIELHGEEKNKTKQRDSFQNWFED
jgi:hypothetical protein